MGICILQHHTVGQSKSCSVSEVSINLAELNSKFVYELLRQDQYREKYRIFVLLEKQDNSGREALRGLLLTRQCLPYALDTV